MNIYSTTNTLKQSYGNLSQVSQVYILMSHELSDEAHI